MRKLLLFILICFTSSAFAQSARKNIDYQYHRGNDFFHAYSAFLNEDKQVIELTLTSSFNISKLKKISIKQGDQLINIPFLKLEMFIENDDQSVNNLAISLNLAQLWKEIGDCDTIIHFTIKGGTQFQLPFNKCKIKEMLIKN